MRSFDEFAALLKEACSGVNVKRSLLEAHQIFDMSILPALRSAGVNIVDSGNYCDASLGVCLVDAPIRAGSVRLKVPLQRGWRKFLNNSLYDAHARFEEVLHLLQFLNEAPLTTTGVLIEEALEEDNQALLSRLLKSWRSGEARRLFVRENDILGVYNELGIELPGLFLFPYDRRGVSNFLQNKATARP